MTIYQIKMSGTYNCESAVIGELKLYITAENLEQAEEYSSRILASFNWSSVFGITEKEI